VNSKWVALANLIAWPDSGQLRLRMPKSLHAALSNEAEEESISLNTYIVTLLSDRHIEKISTFNNRSQTAHKVEEKDKNYRSKKQKK